MSKKIFAITIVKNESDIIESFVRYNHQIFDGMIILDNNSSDNTVEILNLLRAEGINLDILQDDDKDFQQIKKINKLASYAITTHQADIIVPLDADEFLITPHNKNPREFVEMIEFPKFDLIKIKTYYPSFDNEDEKFIPSRITFARDSDDEEYNKIIFPTELVEKFDVKITKGNHSLSYEDTHEDFIEPQLNKNLRIAHFPIRSKEQFISKISVGWINNLNEINRTKNESWHLKAMFDELKRSKEIKNEDITKFARKFSSDDCKEAQIKYDPIDLSFCDDISIKYDSNFNFMTNFLENTETLSSNYLNLKRHHAHEKRRFEQELKKIKIENDNLTKEKSRLENKIINYENSSSWKITAPIRKFTAVLKKLKN